MTIMTHTLKIHIKIMTIMTIMTNKYKADIIKNGIYDNNDRTHIYNAH